MPSGSWLTENKLSVMIGGSSSHNVVSGLFFKENHLIFNFNFIFFILSFCLTSPKPFECG